MSDSTSRSSISACPHAQALGESFNFLDPSFVQDPYPIYEKSRRDAPVFYVPRFDSWVVTRKEEIFAVLKDTARFSNRSNAEAAVPLSDEVMSILKLGGALPAPILGTTDPPEHTRRRLLINSAFTPARVARLEPRIHELSNELIDAFIGKGETDLVAHYALPLPLLVITELLAIPRADCDQVKAWHDDTMRLLAGMAGDQAVACAHKMVTYWKYYEAMIEDRRANPRDDFLTALVNARADGEPPLTNPQIIWEMAILVSAGHESTSGLIWRAIDEDSELLPTAIEEALRFVSPVQFMPRVTTEPVELGGVAIPEKARVLLVYASAGRQIGATGDADRFDIHRESTPQQHLGFGWGTHYCLGAPLARLETRVALTSLRQRLPGLTLSHGFAPGYKAVYVTRCLDQLLVSWDIDGAGKSYGS